jgi:hypothetical protein
MTSYEVSRLTGDWGQLRADDLALVLAHVAGQVRALDPAQLARFDVHPAAVALRDALVEALAGIVALGRYETFRAEARQLKGHLGYVVALFEAGAGDPDPLLLRAYRVELAAQQVGDMAEQERETE